MTKNLAVLILLAISCHFLFSCQNADSGGKKAVAEKGILDLRNWQLERDGPVNLKGQWEIYWEQQVTSRQLQQKNIASAPLFVEVPGLWNNLEYNGKALPGSGFATYRLRVLLKEKKERLSLKLPDMSSAFRVYIDETRIAASGVPGKSPDKTVPRYCSKIVSFETHARSFDIIVHVSNFHHRLGGIWKPVLMGLPHQLHSIREKRIAVSLFLFGLITMMGIYHLGLYGFRRTDISPLFFGVFCLIVAVRIVSHGERYILTIVPDMDYTHFLWLIYLSFYLAVPAFVLYYRAIFPKEFSARVVHFTLFLSGVFSLSIFLLPTNVFTRTILFYQLFTGLLLLYGLLVLYRIIRQKREGSVIFLCGFLFVFLGAVNDILFAYGVIWTAYLFHYALLFFILCQALLIFKRFASAFDTVEIQRKELKREVMEREKIQKDLTESEKKYRYLFENGSDLNWIHDLTGRFLETNIHFKEKYGLGKQDLDGTNIRDIIPEEHRSEFDAYLSRVQSAGSDEGLVTGVTPSGKTAVLEYKSKLMFDETGTPKAVQGAARDITTRFLAEKALRKSEERFRMLSEGTFEAIVVHDNGRILQANPQYYRMFGFTPEALAGKDAIRSTVTPDGVNTVKTQIRENNPGPYEVTGLKRDGTRFPIEIQARVIEYEGHMRRMAAIRDLSDRERAEMEKRDLERRITGGFAHEMRNALSGAQMQFKKVANYQGKGMTSAKVLKESATRLLKNVSKTHDMYNIPKETITADFLPDLKTIAGISDTLSLVHESVSRDIDRGLAITGKIREYAMMSEFRKGDTPVDAVALLKGYENQYKNEFERHGIGYAVSGPDKCIVHADKTHLTSIFSNLILNAKDALAGEDKDNPKIKVFIEKRDTLIRISIQDNGPGIEKKHIKEIFEPFFSTKPTTGAGLGLSIVHRLVRLYKGRIAVETQLNEGTEFKLEFPEKSNG